MDEVGISNNEYKNVVKVARITSNQTIEGATGNYKHG